MNYFELFGLPVQLSVNKNALKKRFLELSRQHHPDYFLQQEKPAQDAALQQSAEINDAFKTLNNEDATIKYVLALKGLLPENEKTDLPPGFLMEMLELNEQVADAMADEDARSTALKEVQRLEAEMRKPVETILTNYNNDTTTDAELQEVKTYYLKKKYLQRLKQQLGEMS